MKPNLFSREKLRAVAFENTLTPLEIAVLLKKPKYRELPFVVARLLRSEPPRRYVRQLLAPSVTFFSAHRGARDLIVGFCGKSRRLMMAISRFLQLIDDELYDVLILADPSQRHYEAGLADFSTSLLGTAQAIETFAKQRHYRRLITYGTSMGGLAAVRAGLWLGADRAISTGARFCSHGRRVLDPMHELPAFDLLCDCRSRHPRSQVVAVFSARHALDRRHFATLRQILPRSIALTFDDDEHCPYTAIGDAELRVFFARLFGEAPIVEEAREDAPQGLEIAAR